MQRPEGQTACHDTHLMKGIGSTHQSRRCPCILMVQDPVTPSRRARDPGILSRGMPQRTPCLLLADSLYNLHAGAGFFVPPPPSGLPAVLGGPSLCSTAPQGKATSWASWASAGLWVKVADPASRLQVNLMVLLAELFMCFEVLETRLCAGQGSA